MANLSNINGKFVVEQTTGYVGVGTTDPNYPIEVLNASAEIALNASGASIYRLRSDNTDSFRINKNGVGDRLVIAGNGNATFAGNVDINGGEVKISGNYAKLFFEDTGGTIDAYIVNNADGLFFGKTNSPTSANDILSLDLSTKNVGIGTTSPGEKLEVKTSGTNTTVKLDNSDTNYTLIQYNAQGALKGFSGFNAGFMIFGGESGTTTRLQSGGSYAATILENGNFGIGTTSPEQKLHVEGTIQLGNTEHLSWAYDNGSYYNYITNGYNSTDGVTYRSGSWTSGQTIICHSFETYTGGWQKRLVIRQDGKVGIGTTLPVEKLSVYDGNISINNSHSFMVGGATGDTIIGRLKNTAGVFNLEANSTRSIRFGSGTNGEVVRIDNVNERVGIGTASPTAKLDIAGDVRYQGDIYSEYTYNGSGNYSSGTIYTIASTGQLTVNGIYQIVMYLDDFGAGGSTYFCWFCSVPFYWVTTGTNRIVSQNLPALIGTGHAIGTIPTFTITQEMGTAGGQAKIRFNPQNNWTNINGTSGRKFVVYVKRLGG